MSLSLNEILITNSPSKRKVLEVGDNGAILSKPNQLDIPDRYYSFKEIEMKRWKKEMIHDYPKRPYADPIEVRDLHEMMDILEGWGYEVKKKPDTNAF